MRRCTGRGRYSPHRSHGQVGDAGPDTHSRRSGVSANRLHGCKQFNVQHISHGGDISRHGLADHFVGLEEEGWGNGEAEGLGGLEVDHQLKCRGLLDGEVGGFGALQDLVHIDCCAPMDVRQTRPIHHEPPASTYDLQGYMVGSRLRCASATMALM